MLYHYTSLQAFDGILRGAPSEKGICFWASRFDCFGDHEEYKVGIETIKNFIPRVEARLPSDRQIASSFDWKSIKENIILPHPYVVSLTKRNNNEYMWENYADHGHGVILALDETGISFESKLPMSMLKSCIYKRKDYEEELFKEIETEYYNGASGMLAGPPKKLAFELLKNNPQLFVRLVAMYLLCYVAPRVKEEEYHQEEEIRIIISSQRPTSVISEYLNMFEGLTDSFGVRTKDIINAINNEHSRKRDNGEIVYYRELFLPSLVLTHVYIKDISIIEKVNEILKIKGFKDTKVRVINS